MAEVAIEDVGGNGQGIAQSRTLDDASVENVRLKIVA